MDVGDVLRLARSRARLSQRALARASGTSQGALAQLESGARSPTVQTLDRLLAACGLQLRVALEPLLADLDAAVDALAGELPELTAYTWRPFADLLDDRPPQNRMLANWPRRGAVRWAVDGASALVLHRLAVAADDLEVVVELDEALRFWMNQVRLVGVGERELPVADWLDADLRRIQTSLDGPRMCMYGLARVRVVEVLPPTILVAVPWLDRPVPVISVDEVERAHPQHADVLARWRQRRSRDVA